MLEVRVAQLFRSFVRLGVIISIGQTESALDGLGNLTRTVFGVLARTESKKRVDTNCVQVRDFVKQIITIFYCLDPFELILNRLDARGIDRFLIHATGIIVTDFLNIRSGLWIYMTTCRFFRDIVQGVIVMLDELIKTAPARIFRWYLRVFDPTPIGVHKKVLLRFDGRIHVLQIEGWRIFLELCRGFSAQAEYANEADKNERS